MQNQSEGHYDLSCPDYESFVEGADFNLVNPYTKPKAKYLHANENNNDELSVGRDKQSLENPLSLIHI